MNNYSKIYWLTRLDPIGEFLIGIACAFFVAGFLYLMIGYIFMDKDYVSDNDKLLGIDKFRTKARARSSAFVLIGSALLLINVFIPTRNEALLIMAGGKTLDYVQSDTALSKIPQQTTAIISGYLDKALTNLRK